MSWGYLSGLLRAEKVHSLDNNTFNTLAETASSETLFKSLEDTVYGSYFQGRSLKEFTSVFNEYYQQKMLQISSLVPCKIIVDVHALKVDLNNLKLCYKAKVANKNMDWTKLSEGGLIAPERMYTIVDQELWNELPNTVAKAVLHVQERSHEGSRLIDFLLDSAYYAHRIEILKKASLEDSKYESVLQLYKMEIDGENIKNMLRAKTMELEKHYIVDIIIPNGNLSREFFMDHAHLSAEDVAEMAKDSPYGDTLSQGIQAWQNSKSCTILEKEIDEMLLSKAYSLNYMSDGPAVIEESIRSLQIEIKNLKLIIIGKLNSMTIDEIKERVRYVGA